MKISHILPILFFLIINAFSVKSQRLIQDNHISTLEIVSDDYAVIDKYEVKKDTVYIYFRKTMFLQLNGDQSFEEYRIPIVFKDGKMVELTEQKPKYIKEEVKIIKEVKKW